MDTADEREVFMISSTLTRALNEQIGNELSAHNHYLAIAVYFAKRSLDGWAGFFFRQAEEEREHAMKILHFLLDNDVAPTISRAEEAKPVFADAVDAVASAVKAERTVTAQFEALMAIAHQENDYRAVPLLHWFLNEQIEEEATMGKLLDLVQSGINLFQAQDFLPEPHAGEQAGDEAGA